MITLLVTAMAFGQALDPGPQQPLTATQFRTLLDQSSTGYGVWKLQDPGDAESFSFVYGNPAAHGLLGWNAQNMNPGSNILDVFPYMAQGPGREYLDKMAAVARTGGFFDGGVTEFQDGNAVHGLYHSHIYTIDSYLIVVDFSLVQVLRSNEGVTTLDTAEYLNERLEAIELAVEKAQIALDAIQTRSSP